MSAPYKTCACGAEYTRDEWSELRFVGYLDDGDGRLELRDCASCGSTIAVELPANGVEGAQVSA